jgi:hypothetical protein
MLFNKTLIVVFALFSFGAHAIPPVPPSVIYNKIQSTTSAVEAAEVRVSIKKAFELNRNITCNVKVINSQLNNELNVDCENNILKNAFKLSIDKNIIKGSGISIVKNSNTIGYCDISGIVHNDNSVTIDTNCSANLNY